MNMQAREAHVCDADAAARRDEEQYVHSVYETIADHFSRTRYKPWPGIASFFDSLEPGSLGLDAGCGNGKYLGLRSILSTETEDEATRIKSVSKDSARTAVETGGESGSMLTVGLDRIANQRGHEVLVGDAINMPWRSGAFDFSISIATIHHFSTHERRTEAVKAMLMAVNKDHGKIFIQVWALEQEPPANANVVNTSKRTNVRKPRDMSKLLPAKLSTAAVEKPKQNDTGSQDVFVPWKLQAKPEQDPNSTDNQQTFQRYYHLFRQGELKGLIMQAARELGLADTLQTDQSEQWEEGNWWIRASLHN